ncbi:MAG: RbsD/FucU domain-containing protein [Flaviflexus sp.]|nr:RbsD/FucU domain-containing protein [Flaviflexus sp.]
MLKNIPACLSPDLVHVLMSMGHGDEIVIADGNFPGDSNNDLVVRADGLGVPELLSAILTLLPLDRYSDWQAGLMETVAGDPTPEIWQTYEEILAAAEGKVEITKFERFAFYEQAKKAFAVVLTSETALYGNIILKKGVVTP